MILEYKIIWPILLTRKRWVHWIDRKKGRSVLLVNLGGGNFCRPGWKSLDYHSPSYPHKKSHIDYNFNLMGFDPLPFDDNSVMCFYSSNTLEHIPQKYMGHIFSEVHRCLCKGGGFRIVVPDFDIAYDHFGRGDYSILSPEFSDPVDKFLNFFAFYWIGRVEPREFRQRFLAMGREAFADYYCERIPPEWQRDNAYNHVTWFTADKLHRMLKNAGFDKVYTSNYQESRFPEMRGDGSFLGLEKIIALNNIQGMDDTVIEVSVFVEAVK